MTDVDARLKTLLAQAAPPAMDPRFRLAVFERVERRRAGVRLALVIAAGALATAGAVAFGPQLTRALGPGVMVSAGVMIAVGTTAWGVLQIRRPI